MDALILVVEDEADLAATLDYNLRAAGYRTRMVGTAQAALEALGRDPLPDLVLLDLMLPDRPGADICRRIRSEQRTQAIPVIMLTAKGGEIDRVVGFEIGADDYVVKPFSVRELLLRIQAVLRRGRPDGAGAGAQLHCGALRVDISGHRVWVDENEVQLTALEFRLLTTLMERRGRVQSRDVLLSDVWGIDADVTTRTVDTHVKRLREKLGPAAGYIETVRGVGYRLEPSDGE